MRVWVTRSQPGADRAAAVLEKHGHCALVAPVVSISQIPAAAPCRTFADVIFLSEHAVRFGVVSMTEAGFDLGSMRVFAVGSATAAWLADIGISAATPPVAGSEGLLALPEFADVSGTDVLIVAGVGGRNVLARGLVDRGARVEKLNVYRRQAVDHLGVDLSDVDAIAVGSGDGFEFMARHWFAADGRADVPVFVPAQRVAALAGQLGFSRVYTCAGADVDALLDGLNALAKDG